VTILVKFDTIKVLYYYFISVILRSEATKNPVKLDLARFNEILHCIQNDIGYNYNYYV